jgi:2-oxoacid:acceptor oxidoreductase delta subunit (pyruvate/2-ketoisovalerate family)
LPLLDEDPKAYPRVIVSTRSMDENRTGNWRTLRPVIDAKACTGCLICWKLCPEACVDLTEKVPSIDMDYCKGCLICVTECPAHCVHSVAEGVS